MDVAPNDYKLSVYIGNDKLGLVVPLFDELNPTVPE